MKNEKRKELDRARREWIGRYVEVERDDPVNLGEVQFAQGLVRSVCLLDGELRFKLLGDARLWMHPQELQDDSVNYGGTD